MERSSHSNSGIGLALLVTFLIELASEFLRFLVQQTWLEAKWHHSGVPWDRGKLEIGVIGIGLTIGAVAIAVSFLESKTDLRGRIWILVTVLILLGALEPGQLLHRATLLHEFNEIHTGQTTAAVLRTIDEEPWLIEEHKDNARYPDLDCVGGCQMRMTYQLPSLWTVEDFTITIGSDGKVSSISAVPEGW
jgi:hypothetical protein